MGAGGGGGGGLTRRISPLLGEYWPKVFSHGFPISIRGSLLVSGDLKNEVHYMRRLVSGHGLKNEVFHDSDFRRLQYLRC